MERCRVQALRYQVEPANRIFYTAQFHAESLADSTYANADLADQHGYILIVNFLTLASDYWRPPEFRREVPPSS